MFSVSLEQKPCRNRSDVLHGDLLLPGMLVKTKANDEWREKYRAQLAQVVSSSAAIGVVICIHICICICIFLKPLYESHMEGKNVWY